MYTVEGLGRKLSVAELDKNFKDIEKFMIAMRDLSNDFIIVRAKVDAASDSKEYLSKHEQRISYLETMFKCLQKDLKALCDKVDTLDLDSKPKTDTIADVSAVAGSFAPSAAEPHCDFE